MTAILSRRVLLGTVLAGPALAACRRRGVGLAVGYMNNLTHAQPLVGAASGRWETALGVRMTAFPAGPAVMEALSAGTLLAGFMGPSAAVNAFVRSGGKRGLVLCGSASGGASFVVQRGSAMQEPSSLRGRLVTASMIASTPDVSLRAYLRQHDLAPRDRGGDVTILPMPNTEAFAMLKRRQIEGVWAQEPWASRMEAEAGARRLFDERELWPDGRFPTALLVTSRRALDEHPRELERLVSLLDDETARLAGAADRGVGEVGAALAKALGRRLPEGVLRDAWGRLELTADPMEQGLQETARRMKEIGYLPSQGTTEGILVRREARAGVGP